MSNHFSNHARNHPLRGIYISKYAYPPWWHFPLEHSLRVENSAAFYSPSVEYMPRKMPPPHDGEIFLRQYPPWWQFLLEPSHSVENSSALEKVNPCKFFPKNVSLFFINKYYI